MKNLKMSMWLVALLVPLGCWCQNEAGPVRSAEAIVRWHFAGRTALAQGTNATRLKLVDTLATTANLRDQIASNLSTVPHKFWNRDLPPRVPNGAALLRPLFDDLLQAESYGEVRGPHDRIEAVLAIELSEDRARLWSTNLWQLVTSWRQGTPLADAGGTGWDLKRGQEPDRLQVLRAGKWTVVSLGPDRLTLAPALLQRIRSGGRPAPATPGELVELEADSTALGRWFALFTDLGLPPFKLTMTSRGENVRTEARLRYAKPLALKYEPWRLPTNIIGEPLSSFSVARGVAPLIHTLIDYSSLGIGPAPNQVCLWGITNDPCRVYFTFPTRDAEGALQKLSLTVPRLIEKAIGPYLGDFFYASNRSTVLWGSLPFIQPYLTPATNAGTEFVHGGIFPQLSPHVVVPPELFAQIGTRTNLVYYDWETTPYRILHANQLYQLLNIVSNRKLQPLTTPSKVWMLDMIRELAKDPMNPSQTVTEITQTAPNELTLTRKSHLGLTGFEIVTLSTWLDSPGFPFRYEPPRHMGLPAGTNAAAAPANPPGVQKR